MNNQKIQENKTEVKWLILFQIKKKMGLKSWVWSAKQPMAFQQDENSTKRLFGLEQIAHMVSQLCFQYS